jgi:pimeloyl-ACP methyl ester carboxylesterase
VAAPLKILLLPGLHGTARLFGSLLDALPPTLAAEVVAYPTDEPLGYEALQARVEARLPAHEPFAIVAESFSSPLAVRIAAAAPEGLVATVLAGGYLRRPIGGWSAPLAAVARPWMLRREASRRMIRRFLVGDDAAPETVEQIVQAVAEVAPEVLAHRVRATLTVDAAEAFRRCPTPLLCIDAARERLLDRSVAPGMKRLRPDVPHEVLDAPHLILHRRPEEAAALIERFCLQAAARPGDVMACS